MGKPRDSAIKAVPPGAVEPPLVSPASRSGGSNHAAPPALEENVQAIKAWERAILLARSKD